MRYQFPYKSILLDLDGTFTGAGAGSWAIHNTWSHNLWDGQCWEDETYDGIICGPDVTVRRVVIHNFAPGNLANLELCVLKYDYEQIGECGDDRDCLRAYEAAGENNSACSIIEYRGKTNPANHWCAPFVTGHRYYVRWEYGVDFEAMDVAIIPELWDDERDKDIKFEMPFYDVREHIHVDPNGDSANRIANGTLSLGRDHNKFGSNKVYNETHELDPDPTVHKDKKLSFAIAGASPNNNYADAGVSFIRFTGVRPVQVEEIEEGEPEGEQFWSDPATWAHLNFDTERIPQDGDQVTIQSTQNITYDIPAEEAPKLISLEINGALNFLPGEARKIRAHRIWVRAGYLNIGSEENPFEDEAIIELLGDNTQHYWSFSSTYEIGNKNLAITGDVVMVGKQRPVVRTRLLQTAKAGSNKLMVDALLDWQVGEKVGVAATNMRTMDYDECTIEAYDSSTGEITCDKDFDGYHYGATKSSEEDYEVDMRAEVWLMDRNIKVVASLEEIGFALQEPWGG